MGALKKTICSRGHDFTLTRKTHPNGDTYCGECKNIRTKQAVKNNPEKQSKYQWKSRIKKTYGLTEETYLGMYVSQNGTCAICKDCIELRGKQTHIDHDHETLEVRGLLCHSCNTALGLFKENKETMLNAINYLKAKKKNK